MSRCVASGIFTHAWLGTSQRIGRPFGGDWNGRVDMSHWKTHATHIGLSDPLVFVLLLTRTTMILLMGRTILGISPGM